MYNALDYNTLKFEQEERIAQAARYRLSHAAIRRSKLARQVGRVSLLTRLRRLVSIDRDNHQPTVVGTGQAATL